MKGEIRENTDGMGWGGNIQVKWIMIRKEV